MVKISHNVIPKDQTSEAGVNFCFVMASGAVHRHGSSSWGKIYIIKTIENIKPDVIDA